VNNLKEKKVPTPIGLTDMQLVRKWTSESGVKRSEAMKSAKNAVTNHTLVGRGGYGKFAEKLVRA
jgi:hypothetical protein